MVLGCRPPEPGKQAYLATERERPVSYALSLLKTSKPSWSPADDFVALTVDEPRLVIPVVSKRRGDSVMSDDVHEEGHLPAEDSQDGLFDAEAIARRLSNTDTASNALSMPPVTSEGRTVASSDGNLISAEPSYQSQDASAMGSTALALPPVALPEPQAKRLLFEGVSEYADDEDRPRNRREDMWTAGTVRSRMLPGVLDNKLQARFMKGVGKQDFFPLKDPAQLTIERLRGTKHVARMARLGEKVYGKPDKGPRKPLWVEPQLADLGEGMDAYDSDDDDGHLRTEHLVADLTAMPLAGARRQMLAKLSLDAYTLPLSERRHWPPRVQSPTRDGPLAFRGGESRSPPRARGSTASSMSLAMHEDSLPRFSSPRVLLAAPSTRRASVIMPEATHPQRPPVKHPPPSSRGPQSRQQGKNSEAEKERSPLPTARLSTGREDRWLSSRDWAHRNQARMQAHTQDVMVEEMFDAGLVSQRQAVLPLRRCYDLQTQVRAPPTHRAIGYAAEAGPEASAGPLSRHSVKTSSQAQAEMIRFQRRLDRLLLQTPGHVNLAHSLACPRLFSLLLIALPANPGIEKLVLAHNDLDDGHAEALAEKLMRAGSVKHLDLSHNRLSWVAISNIAEMLTARPSSFGGNQTKLTSLTLDHNPIGSRGAEILAGAVLQTPSLQSLSVRKCDIGGTGAIRFGSMLSESPTITSLDLSWNTLGLQGIKAVLVGLGLSPTLKSLNLSNNYFGDAAGPHILEGLRLNENLTELDVSHNFLSFNTCQAIASGFAANNKLKLRKLVMDSNHCTLAGGALLLRLIEPAGRHLELSLRECTFDKTGHKTEFDAAEPEGSYLLDLAVPEQRAAAVALAKARNQQHPQAWQVCQLNGEQWQPAGPWDPEPERLEVDKKGEKAKKGAEKKEAGKDRAGGVEEEEEAWMDPRLPQAAIPKEGELLVEFRNVFMPQAYGLAAEPMTDEVFARLWTAHQRRDTTDQWRLDLVRVLCCRYWWSMAQAATVLRTFLHPKEKVLAAESILWRLVSYAGLGEVIRALSQYERNYLLERTGLCGLVNCRSPIGHYVFDLRSRLQNCAANLLQSMWRAEIAAGDCVGPVASCWRNTLLDGEPVAIAPTQPQPAVGLLSLDFISYKREAPLEVDEEGMPVEKSKEEWKQLTPTAFTYLLHQLTDAESTATALGDAHFMSLLKEWQSVGLEEDEVAGLKRTKSAKVRRRAAASAGNADAIKQRHCRQELEDMMQPSAERAALKRSTSLSQVKLGFVSKLLRQTDKAFGHVVNPAEALRVLQAVVETYTVDYKQALIFMHRFPYESHKRVEVLKKLFTRIEDRERHISSIVEFGLSEQERAEATSCLGILNLTSWTSPSGHYRLSMDREDHRFCLLRLVKKAVASGSVDVRMFSDFKINGRVLPSQFLQEKQLWDRLLDETQYEQLSLVLTATNPRLSKLMHWFHTSAPVPSPLDLRAAVESVGVDAPEAGSAPPTSRPADGSAGHDAPMSTPGESTARSAAPTMSQSGAASDASLASTPPEEHTGPDVVDFVFEAAPELRHIGAVLLSVSRWKRWSRQKRTEREERAMRRIETWWYKRQQTKKLREMQAMLDEQERASST